MQWIIFHKVDVPGPLLVRGLVRFDSCKRPPPASDHSVFAFSVVAYGRLVSLASVLWMSRSIARHPRTTCDIRVRLWFEKQSCIQPSWSISFQGCIAVHIVPSLLQLSVLSPSNCPQYVCFLWLILLSYLQLYCHNTDILVRGENLMQVYADSLLLLMGYLYRVSNEPITWSE